MEHRMTGALSVDIILSTAISFEPPKMKFTAKVAFPLVHKLELYADILKDKWSPALAIKTALLSLQALLCAPEPDDPQDAQVAGMYNKIGRNLRRRRSSRT